MNELPEAKVQIHADRHRLEQVFDYLLGNAVKYSPAGGAVQVRGDWRDGELMICVEDQGVGIPADQHERVFDKFYRVESGATAVSGLGLGLSITRNIIEEHGGRIWLESALEAGTRIFFTLPYV